MINIRLLSCFILLTTLASCSLSNVATTSFRGGFDFSIVESYSTYNRNSAFGDIQNLNDSTRNNIELAIEQGFDGNGFDYKTLQKADIVIAYHIINQNFNQLKLYNRHVKYCAYCLKAGQATGKELQSKLSPGSLILDIIDSKNQRSVWRSVYPLNLKGKDNSREIQKKISDAVDSMLQDLPKKRNLTHVVRLAEQFA